MFFNKNSRINCDPFIKCLIDQNLKSFFDVNSSRLKLLDLC